MDNKEKQYLNYSKEYGKSIQDISIDKISLKHSLKCKTCGTENKCGLYCSSCGTSLEEVTSKESLSINNYFKMNLKPMALVSIASAGILFLISLVIKLFISLSLGDLVSIVNPLHIILAMNLSTISLNTYSIIGSESIGIHLGILVIALIPLIVLCISNFIFIKNKSSRDVLYNSIGVGVLYGVILIVISIFATTSVNISNMISYGVSITFKYKILELFLNGFILGFISTYLIGYKKKYSGQNIYLDIFRYVIFTIFTIYISIFVILLGITILDRSYLYELGLYNYSESNLLILSQLALYVLDFANIIPVTIGTSKLSILSLLNGDLFFHTKIMFMAMIFLSLLVLIVAGYNLRKKMKNQSNKKVMIFSIFYSISMTILSSFTNIYIGGSSSLLQASSYQSNIFMGTQVISTFIISFIYSYIIVKVGYTLSDFE
ncbi:hypothetical protein [Romboutsia sp. 13368]|uniref:hypothetical protein n=1 Tax=Romboutsia sp. 13368 TaxID=2708053 RepID=UPI0025CD1D80|nr:hypothetical protein [Romboutsia sp. 13368]